MALTDTAIRNAKPTEKSVKLSDGGGLYLLLNPNGSRWWRLDYRFDGKRKTLSMGVYPDVTLKDARARRDEARKLLAVDVDPGENRKALKAAKKDRATNSFEVIAREWYAKFSPTWSESHGDRTIRRFERDIFPWLGDKPIAEISPPRLLETVRRIEQRGALETAHRALSNCGQVFRYAIATGRAQRDISADLQGALPPVKANHFAAVTDPQQVAELLRAMDCYSGSLIVRYALRLAPLVFVRPGELRKAEWADVDLDAAEWRYIVTKTNTPHIVPLSKQAVEILTDLQALTGGGRYLFPGARTNGRPMSDNAILAAFRRMGIPKEEMTGHGFRAMARTILDEVLGYRPDIIEHQLAHSVKDPNGRAYNRTAHLAERRKMMQEWSDYLDNLKEGAQIIPLHTAA
ncbi:MAG TPA: integrase arm-type DNA-binding domain-containing protein [Thiobacillaceae bacterium]|nr:integrase arm-type DNA-binding domain-containing protein [Thiobacillaceae bacterium]